MNCPLDKFSIFNNKFMVLQKKRDRQKQRNKDDNIHKQRTTKVKKEISRKKCYKVEFRESKKLIKVEKVNTRTVKVENLLFC